METKYIETKISLDEFCNQNQVEFRVISPEAYTENGRHYINVLPITLGQATPANTPDRKKEGVDDGR